jgi:AraC-like DNA-binding protein
VAWRPRRDDAFPISIFRREAHAVIHRAELHAHDFFTLMFVDAGEGVMRMVGREMPMKRGDIQLLPPGEPHDTTGLRTVSGWAVEFTADAVGEAHGLFGTQYGRLRWLGFQRLYVPGGGVLALPQEDWARTDKRLQSLHCELEKRRPAYQEAAQALLRLLLIDVMRVATGGLALPQRLSPVVEEVFGVIDARFAEPLGLAAVARAVGRSPSYVTNVVRTQTQLTVLDWIVERRLDEARRLLRESDEDVAIVGERVGYATVDHFIRQFRRAHGLTPGAWRRALQT